MSKMVSPQNVATGVAVTNLRGREGTGLVAAQGDLFRWMAPIVGAAK